MAFTVFAAITTFATPRPKITIPMMTPSIGPGKVIAVKEYLIAFSAGIMKIIPLAESNPATKSDLCFHDTMNAPAANAMATMLNTGVGPTLKVTATLPKAFTMHIPTVAADSPTAKVCFKFFTVCS